MSCLCANPCNSVSQFLLWLDQHFNFGIENKCLADHSRKVSHLYSGIPESGDLPHADICPGKNGIYQSMRKRCDGRAEESPAPQDGRIYCHWIGCGCGSASLALAGYWHLLNR